MKTIDKIFAELYHRIGEFLVVCGTAIMVFLVLGGAVITLVSICIAIISVWKFWGGML